MSGLLAEFADEEALREALRCLNGKPLGAVETYTPKALDEHPGGSPLPLVMFAAGMLGFIGFFALMAYADIWAYPQDIGGRPNFAWPAFVPIAFELGVLCAMAAGFVGYFVVCHLPRLHDPIDECDGFRRSTRDGWFIAVRSDDPHQIEQAQEVLQAMRPASVQAFGS